MIKSGFKPLRHDLAQWQCRSLSSDSISYCVWRIYPPPVGMHPPWISAERAIWALKRNYIMCTTLHNVTNSDQIWNERINNDKFSFSCPQDRHVVSNYICREAWRKRLWLCTVRFYIRQWYVCRRMLDGAIVWPTHRVRHPYYWKIRYFDMMENSNGKGVYSRSQIRIQYICQH